MVLPAMVPPPPAPGGIPFSPPPMPMGGPPMPPPGMMPPGAMPSGMMGGLPPMMPPLGGAPGIMGGPMMGPPPDPMSGMIGPMTAPPDPMQELLSLFQNDPELFDMLFGPPEIPKNREFWQEPPKPTEAEMLTKARSDERYLSALNQRFDDNIARIEGKSVGVFPDHDPDEDIQWRTGALKDEDRMIMAIVGTIDPYFESPARRPSDEDESQAKEDFATYLHEEHIRQHKRAGHGDLQMEMVKTITRYGRIVTRNVCRLPPAHGKAPFVMEMIDPSVVYPTFEGERGLTRVTLIYWMQVGNFLGWHDRDGTIETKLRGKKNAKTGSPYEDTDTIEVIEYWDCKWFGLFAAGGLVKQESHDYGEPPFVYTLAPYGAPNYTRTPNQTRDILINGSTYTPIEIDFAERGLSHFANQFEQVAQFEAVLGKMASHLDKWGDEEVWLAQDDSVYNKGTPDIKRKKGARNILRSEHEQLLPNPEHPLPPTAPALIQQAAQDAARGALGPIDYGMNPAAQTAGYAIQGLSEKAERKIAPVKRTVESHLAACAEQRLRFYMEWGDKLGEPGTLGTVTYPKTMPSTTGKSEWWTLKPEMVYKTGWTIKCHLVDTPDVQALGGMANALAIIGKQGLITKRDAIKMLGLPGSRNPEQTIKDVKVEQIEDMPEFKLSDMLQYVAKPPEQGGLGNKPMADFILSLIVKMQAQNGQPGMGGPPGGGGPPGAPPQGPGVQGQSNPMMGRTVGTLGGRPPGVPGGGPPPNMPPPGIVGPGTER